MRRTFAVLLGALLMTTVAGAQEREMVLSERQWDELAFLRRVAATLPRIPTFRYEGKTYFVEHVWNGSAETTYVQLVDLYGNQAPDGAKVAFVTRDLPLPAESGQYEFTVVDPDEYYREVDARRNRNEGLVHAWSVHWVPIGVARSYREPAGKGKQNYLPFALGATVFTHRVDGGRLYLFGAGAGFAVGNSNPDSEWTGTLHITFVPVSVRVRDRWQIAPTFGTAEITGRSLLRWKGFKTVGVQVSVCVSNCGDD